MKRKLRANARGVCAYCWVKLRRDVKKVGVRVLLRLPIHSPVIERTERHVNYEICRSEKGVGKMESLKQTFSALSAIYI